MAKRKIDYFETFGSFVNVATIKAIFNTIVHFDWKIQQIDVNNVCQNGELNETIFIHQSKGFYSNQLDDINNFST